MPKAKKNTDDQEEDLPTVETTDSETQADENPEVEPQEVATYVAEAHKLDKIACGACAGHAQLQEAKNLLDEVAELAKLVVYFPGGVSIRQSGPEHDFAFPQPAAHALKALLTKLNNYARR
jgi:hypothetical protein